MALASVFLHFYSVIRILHTSSLSLPHFYSSRTRCVTKRPHFAPASSSRSLPQLHKMSGNLVSQIYSLLSPPLLQGTKIGPKCCSLPRSLPRQLRKSSLHCSRCRLHRSSGRLLFLHRPVQDKVQKDGRLSPHCLKIY